MIIRSGRAFALAFALAPGLSGVGCSDETKEQSRRSRIGSLDPGSGAVAATEGEPAEDTLKRGPIRRDPGLPPPQAPAPPPTTPTPPTRKPIAPGPINGAFVHLGYSAGDATTFPTSGVPAALEEFARLGIRYFIVIATLDKTSCTTDSFAEYHDLDAKLKALAANAALYDPPMTFHVGTIMSIDPCALIGQPYTLAANVNGIEARTPAHVRRIESILAGYPAFAGLYIPDEAELINPQWNFDYHRRISTAIRGASSRQIVSSPYFHLINAAGVVMTPQQLGDAVRLYRTTAPLVDVLIPQDTLGNQNTPNLGWARTLSPLFHTYKQYVDAMVTAAGGKDRLWINHEIFAGGDFAGEANPAVSGLVFTAASPWRTKRQVEQSQAAGRHYSWLVHGFMSEQTGFNCAKNPACDLQPRLGAKRTKAEYLALHKLDTSRVILGRSDLTYTWTTAPYDDGVNRYTDPARAKLLDGQAGDRMAPTDPSWVGVNGDAELAITLTRPRVVKWASVHALHTPSWGIQTPSVMSLTCVDDPKQPRQLFIKYLTFNPGRGVGEHAFGNDDEIVAATPCQKLRLRLGKIPQAAFVFLSELTLTALAQ